MKYLIIPVCCFLFAWACSPRPYASSNKAYRKQAKQLAALLKEYPLKDSVPMAPFTGTTNFSLRRPNFVIIHHTAQNSCEQTLKTFTLPRTQVSSHYVICKDGSVYHMLNDLLRAHHAGVSKWGNSSDINSSSIGIEIDNNGSEAFTEAQINSLQELLGWLKRAYNIPAANFIGHSDIAPGRKVDPNKNFPWQKLAENGYGLWYDTTGIQVPVGFNEIAALRIIGYNVQKPASAISSFKLHFVSSDTTVTLTEADRKILYSLQQRYQ